jgi:hypothetical protein
MIYYEDHYIKVKLATGSTGTAKSKAYYASSSDVAFTIHIVGGNFMLGYALKTTKGQSVFDLTSDVLLNNVKNAELNTTPTNVIYYKKP